MILYYATPLLHTILESNGYIAIESKFCYSNIKDIIPTDEEYNKYSPDAVIRNACQVLGLDCYEMQAHTSRALGL